MIPNMPSPRGSTTAQAPFLKPHLPLLVTTPSQSVSVLKLSHVTASAPRRREHATVNTTKISERLHALAACRPLPRNILAGRLDLGVRSLLLGVESGLVLHARAAKNQASRSSLKQLNARPGSSPRARGRAGGSRCRASCRWPSWTLCPSLSRFVAFARSVSVVRAALGLLLLSEPSSPDADHYSIISFWYLRAHVISHRAPGETERPSAARSRLKTELIIRGLSKVPCLLYGDRQEKSLLYDFLPPPEVSGNFRHGGRRFKPGAGRERESTPWAGLRGGRGRHGGHGH